MRPIAPREPGPEASGSAEETEEPALRVALYETTMHGHRGAYLVAIATEAVRRGWSVTVVTPARDRTHTSLDRIRELVGRSNLVFTPFWVDFPRRPSARAMLRYHFEQWRAARRSLAWPHRQWDFVYALNIDYMDKAIQLLGAPSYPTPMGGMTMRMRFHLRRLGLEPEGSSLPSLASVAFSRLLRARGMACVTTADPSLLQYCRGKRGARYRKLAYVPELGMIAPRLDSAMAKSSFGFAPGDRVILVFGVIDRRKAFEELTAAIAHAAPEERLRVLIVGQPDEAADRTLAGGRFDELRRAGVVATRLGFASDQVQELAFAAADIVWVAYRNHDTMSGVFSQAMSCALPVIGPARGVLCWLVRHHDVGITVDIDDPQTAQSRIREMLGNEERLQRYRSNAGRVAREHRPERFAGAICDVIAGGMGARSPRPARPPAMA